MSPLVRIWLTTAAVAGICLVGHAMWPLVAGNLIAQRSWTRAEGTVRAMNGTIEFELGSEPASYRAFAVVDHTWGLTLFRKAPLFVDPADPTRVKPAGFTPDVAGPGGDGGVAAASSSRNRLDGRVNRPRFKSR